jgi:hypothetical protein
VTYVGTSVEALSTVTSVKQKGLVALNEAELIAQTFDLERKKVSISAEIHVAFLFTDLGRGDQWWKR